MAKRLLVLMAVLAATLLAVAVPAFAQQEEVAITGNLYQTQGGYYTVIDEAGQDRLLSDGGAGLGAYVGEVVTLYGTPAGDVPEFFAPFYASPLLNITRVEPADGPPRPGGPSPEERTATFSFELTVKGEPPADARFFGVVPAEGCISAPLADPDADGVFTGSLDVPRFPPGPVPPDAEPVSLPVQIVRADGGASPCDPTGVIEDFGTVPADDDTFEASVSFEDGRGGTTPPEGTTPDTTTPDSGGGGSGDSSSGSGSGDSVSSDGGSSDSADSGSSGSGGGNSGGGSDSGSSGSGGAGNDAASSGSPGGATGGIRGLLPSTGGGVALWVLGAGVLLIGGGLLVRKLAR